MTSVAHSVEADLDQEASECPHGKDVAGSVFAILGVALGPLSLVQEKLYFVKALLGSINSLTLYGLYNKLILI